MTLVKAVTFHLYNTQSTTELIKKVSTADVSLASGASCAHFDFIYRLTAHFFSDQRYAPSVSANKELVSKR